MDKQERAEVHTIFNASSQSPSSSDEVVKKASKYGFLWPYLIGLLSGVVVAYLTTILMGYFINKFAAAASPFRSAFYGYLVGCQGP